MSSLSLMFALATGSALVAGTPAQPNFLPPNLVVTTVEAGQLELQLPTGDATRELFSSEVVENPDHGQVNQRMPSELTYQPLVDPVFGENYFGRDQFRLHQKFKVSDEVGVLVDVLSEADATDLYATFDVNVLPRFLPISGKWTADTPKSVGLWDNTTQSFILCDGAQTELDDLGIRTFLLSCWRYPVANAPQQALIPLVYPGEPVDQLALFAPNTGDLYDVAGPNPYFEAVPAVRYENAIGSFPILGSWAENEPATLAFVAPSGEIGSLDAAGNWQNWPQPIGLWPGEHLTWPVRFPGDGHDLIALVEPRFADLQTVSLAGQLGSIDGPDFPPSFQLDFRRPVNGAANLELPGEGHSELGNPPLDGIMILTFTASGLELKTIHYRGEGDDPNPETVQIKFPNDPATPP